MEQLILEGTCWNETVGELDIAWKFLPGHRVIQTCIYGPIQGTWKFDGKTLEVNFEIQKGLIKKTWYIGEIREYDIEGIATKKIFIEGYEFSLFADGSPQKSKWFMIQSNPRLYDDWNWG